ncbi:hypothetical protein ACFQ1S_04960 [Kibdelosporangium lantanae]|uniref:Uncharacterized protein n=1 Tax=Kibdelosporangium lantanae TaxID=1497396 RepID=A0ABW3M2V6_9PSEU
MAESSEYLKDVDIDDVLDDDFDKAVRAVLKVNAENSAAAGADRLSRIRAAYHEKR